MNKNQLNIVNALMLANKEEIEQGKTWYLKHRNICKSIAKANNKRFMTVCGVFAALSPSCPIERNIKDTIGVIGSSFYKCATYGNNKEKAENILALEKPTVKKILKILNGQKVQRFFLNLYSPRYNVVTIDRHAISLYFGTFDHKFIQTPKRISRIRNEYKEIAEKFNLRPYQLQAITWLTWKRINNI